MAELKYSTSTATGPEQSAEDERDIEQEETNTPAENTTADDDADPEGADALGDPGKKALQVMKEQRSTYQYPYLGSVRAIRWRCDLQ